MIAVANGNFSSDSQDDVEVKGVTDGRSWPLDQFPAPPMTKIANPKGLEPEVQPTEICLPGQRPLNSAIYQGRIFHRRYRPRLHQFCYSIYMAWIDLDELDRLFCKPLWCSRHWFSAVQFRRSDYHGDAQTNLADSIRQLVVSRTGVHCTGPIRLLTHLRYFGFNFNPVSFYYCYAADGCSLEFIVAEVTNTPWREKHCYIIPCAGNAGHHEKASFKQVSQGNSPTVTAQSADINYACPKVFHVSPFMNMDMEYHWRLSQPADRLTVEINNIDAEGCIFTARLELTKRPFTHQQLASALLKFPLITLKVVVAIYWQALKIWWKKVPYVPHPQTENRDI